MIRIRIFSSLFIILCCLYNVISSTSFIKDGKRAEFFELTDTTVPTFKINIPQKDFILMKKTAQLTRFGGLNSVQVNYIFSITIQKIVDMLKTVNFNLTFTDPNIKETLPLLNIDENGFPNIDVNQVLNGYDFTLDHDDFSPYENYDASIKQFLQTNSEFNLNEVLQSVANLTMVENPDISPILLDILKSYQPPKQKQKPKKNHQYYYEENDYTNTYSTNNENNDDNSDVNEEHTNGAYVDYGNNEYSTDDGGYHYNYDGDYNDYSTDNAYGDYGDYDDYNDDYNYDYDYDYEEDNSSKTVFHYALLLNIEEKFTLQYPSFKTKNGSLIVEINGEQKKFKKITFSLSGKNSRYYPKPNYNLKIRGSDELYGRSQFKLRSDSIEPSFLRSKLIADIHNRLEVPSISANYIQLYINEEYMGLYIITDIFKKSWVKKVFGEEHPSNLYKCDDSFLNERTISGCKNENDNDDNSNDIGNGNENKEVINSPEWNEFIQAIERAESIADIENLLDVDQFLTEMALEYLLRSVDHLQNGQNYYMYKPQGKDGKWIYLTHDFDLDFGQDNFSEIDTPFQNFFKSHIPIQNKLILKDPTRFEMKLQEVVEKVFNPATLFPRIDELKQFIKPYVELDKIPNADGRFPGALNTKCEEGYYTLEQWESNTEFETVMGVRKAYGLKYWILSQYRNVCSAYPTMNCDALYMDENYN